MVKIQFLSAKGEQNYIDFLKKDPILKGRDFKLPKKITQKIYERNLAKYFLKAGKEIKKWHQEEGDYCRRLQAFFNKPLNFKVRLTVYGPGGSYSLPEKMIIAKINSKFSLSYIIKHELVHLMLEPYIIKYKIEHGKKEKIVKNILEFL